MAILTPIEVKSLEVLTQKYSTVTGSLAALHILHNVNFPISNPYIPISREYERDCAAKLKPFSNDYSNVAEEVFISLQRAFEIPVRDHKKSYSKCPILLTPLNEFRNSATSLNLPKELDVLIKLAEVMAIPTGYFFQRAFDGGKHYPPFIPAANLTAQKSKLAHGVHQYMIPSPIEVDSTTVEDAVILLDYQGIDVCPGSQCLIYAVETISKIAFGFLKGKKIEDPSKKFTRDAFQATSFKLLESTVSFALYSLGFEILGNPYNPQ